MLTILGVFSGTAVGLLIKNSSAEAWTQREIMYIQYPGDLFLRYTDTIDQFWYIANIKNKIIITRTECLSVLSCHC